VSHEVWTATDTRRIQVSAWCHLGNSETSVQPYQHPLFVLWQSAFKGIHTCMENPCTIGGCLTMMPHNQRRCSWHPEVTMTRSTQSASIFASLEPLALRCSSISNVCLEGFHPPPLEACCMIENVTQVIFLAALSSPVYGPIELAATNPFVLSTKA